MNTKHTKYIRKKRNIKKTEIRITWKNAFMYLCLPLSSVSVKINNTKLTMYVY